MRFGGYSFNAGYKALDLFAREDRLYIQIPDDGVYDLGLMPTNTMIILYKLNIMQASTRR